MPYSTLENSDRLAVKAARFGLYLAIMLGGLAALVSTPQTIEGVLGYLTYVWGAGAVLSGAVACLSVLQNNWMREGVAVWFCASSYSLYATTIFVIASGGNPTRLAQAFTTLGFVLALVSHGVYLGGRARILRNQHHISERQ